MPQVAKQLLVGYNLPAEALLAKFVVKYAPGDARPESAPATKALFEQLDKAGIKVIGPGDVTDDDQLNGMGDVVIGDLLKERGLHPAPIPAVEVFIAGVTDDILFFMRAGYTGSQRYCKLMWAGVSEKTNPKDAQKVVKDLVA